MAALAIVTQCANTFTWVFLANCSFVYLHTYSVFVLLIETENKSVAEGDLQTYNYIMGY